MENKIKLTTSSKGSGCGCKIAPAVLEQILGASGKSEFFKQLLVGNDSRDDAAVWDLGSGDALISTTDFFTAIVDDPYDFGRIAATNALSDVYAMGGKPIMALAILGWPIDKIPVEHASLVLKGAVDVCTLAGIPLAGGHSIDVSEPIFGLSVNGLVNKANLKKNAGAKENDLIYITKPIGIGILSSALKRGLLDETGYASLINITTKLNTIGIELGKLGGVNGLTDVTGFGLGGHVIEMANGSNLTAVIDYKKIPLINGVQKHIDAFCYPDNTTRNWNSYREMLIGLEGLSFMTMFDPQTSGGLLISADAGIKKEIEALFKENKLDDFIKPIGYMTKRLSHSLEVINAF